MPEELNGKESDWLSAACNAADSTKTDDTPQKTRRGFDVSMMKGAFQELIKPEIRSNAKEHRVTVGADLDCNRNNNATAQPTTSFIMRLTQIMLAFTHEPSLEKGLERERVSSAA